jgi:protein-S-isoprenylcysteine O-methyltransferase Ste14
MSARVKAAAGSIVFLAVAPGVVAGLIPYWLTGWDAAGDVPTLQVVAGAALVMAGAAVLLNAFARFVLEGIGTPAPVAPTEHLVVGGLYRYVRNPMYIAVATTIFGQMILLGRPGLVLYALAFMAAVWSFAHWYEEPVLATRYGAEYEEYRRTVRGWFPGRRRIGA